MPKISTSKIQKPKVAQASEQPVEKSDASMPRVLNKRRDGVPATAVYVGRPSKWGNPFALKVDGNRDEVIEKFRVWLLASTLMDEVHELRGKDLVCWCAPARCHADILLDIANGGTRYFATEVHT